MVSVFERLLERRLKNGRNLYLIIDGKYSFKNCKHPMTDENTLTYNGMLNCKICNRISQRKTKSRNIENGKHRAYQRSVTLGIKNVPEVEGNICAICGKIGKMSADHDHKTKEFRNWVCNQRSNGGPCNTLIDMIEDQLKITTKAELQVLFESISKHLKLED